MSRKISVAKTRRILELAAEKLTQAEIAERLGISQPMVCVVEQRNGIQRRKRRSFADSATGLRKPKPPPPANEAPDPKTEEELLGLLALMDDEEL